MPLSFEQVSAALAGRFEVERLLSKGGMSLVSNHNLKLFGGKQVIIMSPACASSIRWIAREQIMTVQLK